MTSKYIARHICDNAGMTVTVKLFGAFRQYTTENPVQLNIAVPTTAAKVREELRAYADANWQGVPPGLIDASAISTSSEVLRDGDQVTETELAILPPVSGG